METDRLCKMSKSKHKQQKPGDVKTKTRDCEDQKKSVFCDVCNKIFKRASYLKVHMRIHSGERPYQCNLCTKTFSQVSTLNIHKKIHTGEKNFKCTLCEKRFYIAAECSRHMKTHTGERHFKCGICDKTFIRSSKLQLHIRVHTGDRPYICEVCGRRFAQSTNLSTHMKHHTGDLPFKCKTCNKQFTHGSLLNNHSRIHTGEKPFMCDTCGKSFADGSKLKIHVRLHRGEKPFKCQVCDKSYAIVGDLRKHSRTHTGERPYNCNQCDKSFALASRRKSHMRTHTGEKPYQCGECGRRFADNTNLRRHKKNHIRKRLNDMTVRQGGQGKPLLYWEWQRQRSHKTGSNKVDAAARWEAGKTMMSLASQDKMKSNDADTQAKTASLGLQIGSQPMPACLNSFSSGLNNSSLFYDAGLRSTIWSQHKQQTGCAETFTCINVSNEEMSKTFSNVFNTSISKTTLYQSVQNFHSSASDVSLHNNDCYSSVPGTLAGSPAQLGPVTQNYSQEVNRVESQYQVEMCNGRTDNLLVLQALQNGLDCQQHTLPDSGQLSGLPSIIPHLVDTNLNLSAYEMVVEQGDSNMSVMPGFQSVDDCVSEEIEQLSQTPEGHKPLGHEKETPIHVIHYQSDEGNLEFHHQGIQKDSKLQKYEVTQGNLELQYHKLHDSNEYRTHESHKGDGGQKIYCAIKSNTEQNNQKNPEVQIHYTDSSNPLSFQEVSKHETCQSFEKNSEVQNQVLPEQTCHQSSDIDNHQSVQEDQNQDNQHLVSAESGESDVDDTNSMDNNSTHCGSDLKDNKLLTNIKHEMSHSTCNSENTSTNLKADRDGLLEDSSEKIQLITNCSESDTGEFCNTATPNVCTDSEDKFSGRTVLSSGRDQQFTCDVCSKGFGRKNHLKLHLRTHSGEKPYRCDICGKCFSQSSTLKLHKQIHTGIKSFACDVCAKHFYDAASLTRHMKTHTGDRPYRCEVCDKSFLRSAKLKIHLRLHTGERPYVCHLCGKRFTQTTNLKTHVMQHVGDLPFQCKVCGKGFVYESILKIHTRTHTQDKQFMCDVCGTGFVQPSYLERHMRTHTGERPYKCQVCGRGFAASSDLKSHTMRTHTKERPHKCSVCDKAFTRVNDLLRHKRKHTGEKPYTCQACWQKFADGSNLRRHIKKYCTNNKVSSVRTCLQQTEES